MSEIVKPKKSLLEYKRRETIFITLPSQAKSYSPGQVILAPSGELGIKPMTTADQITLSNPESLISGDATVKIIESCVPGINDPSHLLSPDIEAIYAGIRLATYGENTEIEVNCPKCEKHHAFDMPIRYSLENMTFLPEDPKVTVEVKNNSGELDKLEVYVRPYTLVEATKDANIKFQQSKAAQVLFEDDVSMEDDLKKTRFYTSLQNIAEETVKLVSACIVKIQDPDTLDEFDLEDQPLILEWINNLPASEAEKITKLVETLNTGYGIKKELTITCDGCAHEWTTQINFDPTNFFE